MRQGKCSPTERIRTHGDSRLRRLQLSKQLGKGRRAAHSQHGFHPLKYKTVQVFPGQPTPDICYLCVVEESVDVAKPTLCTVYPAPNCLISHCQSQLDT